MRIRDKVAYTNLIGVASLDSFHDILFPYLVQFLLL